MSLEKLFKKLSDKELGREIERISDLMVTGGPKSNSEVAYGAVILFKMLTYEQDERQRKKEKIPY